MTLTVTAPGKLVLLGEYVVLEGAPALVAAVDRRARVQVVPQAHFALTAPDLHIDSAAFHLTAQGDVAFDDPAWQAHAPLRLFCHAVGAVQRHAHALNTGLRPCHLHLDTGAFLLRPHGPKLGLGSSAALTVCLVAALLAEAGLLADPLTPKNQYAVMDLAHAAHTAAQGGAGSGVDVAAAVYGGLLRFTRPGAGPVEVVALPMLPELAVVPVWANAAASTPQLLDRVAALKRNDPPRYWEIMEKLAIYAHAGVEFWALRNIAALRTVIAAYYDSLKTLGEAAQADIVTAEHRAIHDLVLAAGGLYKPSGAGGGDLGVAFCPVETSAKRLTSRLTRRGYQVVPINLDSAGVQVARA